MVLVLLLFLLLLPCLVSSSSSLRFLSLQENLDEYTETSSAEGDMGMAVGGALVARSLFPSLLGVVSKRRPAGSGCVIGVDSMEVFLDSDGVPSVAIAGGGGVGGRGGGQSELRAAVELGVVLVVVVMRDVHNEAGDRHAASSVVSFIGIATIVIPYGSEGATESTWGEVIHVWEAVVHGAVGSSVGPAGVVGVVALSCADTT